MGNCSAASGVVDPDPITVIVESAKRLKNMDVGSLQDPYCRVSLGKVCADTAVVPEGGTDPTWTLEQGTVLLSTTQLSEVAAQPGQHLMTIDIFDRDNMSGDDCIGTSYIWVDAVARHCLRNKSRRWQGEVQVFRKSTKCRGSLQIQIVLQECHLQAFRQDPLLTRSSGEDLIEATPGKVHRNVLPGIVQAMQEGDPFGIGGFHTYEVALQRVAEIFGDSWNYGKDGAHPETFADDARGAVLRKALSTIHHQLYYDELIAGIHIRTDSTILGRVPGDFLKLIHYGVRSGRRRVFTYAITDAGFCFSETGAALSKDNLSKHAIHADGAMAVRYSGTFRICERGLGEAPQADYVLVIDNDSGTYRPSAGHAAQLKRLLELNFLGLEVCCLDVCSPQPEGTMAWVGPNERKGDEKAVYPGGWVWQDAVPLRE